MENKYDIIIVGGGPAGVSTWLYLNKYNPELASKSILIEREIYPRDKLCGGALGGWTEGALDYLQLKINVPSVKIQNLECKLGEEKITIRDEKFFRVVRRYEFDHELIKAALDRGMILSEAEPFINFVHNRRGLIVKTEKRKFETKVLIGADGANSMVRKKMNLPLKPNIAPGIELFTKAISKINHEYNNKTAVIDFSLLEKGFQGYVWHFPCIIDKGPGMNHGIIDFRISSDRSRFNLKRLLERELQNRNLVFSHKHYHSHFIPWITDKHVLHQPNILLVGDAAGIEPAIGGGIHLAFSYGQIAAKKIYDAFENKNFNFKDYETTISSNLLGRYIFSLVKTAHIMYTDSSLTLNLVKDIFKKKDGNKVYL